MRSNWSFLWTTVLLFGTNYLLAESEGIYEDRIVFGQSACLTGPNARLGLSYQAGILAAFEEYNKDGGLDGKRIELITRDDGYEPERAATNADFFIEENNVLAIIGGVGTPTARRLAPMFRTADIAFVGHITGADFLFDTEQFPNVTILRASYLDEVRTLIAHIVEKLDQRRIGIIFQDDSFGRSILRDLLTVLDEYELPLLAKTRFSRNTHAVHASLFEIAKADLDAILLVGTYASNATIINLANSLGYEYTMANLSFSLSRELRSRLDVPNAQHLVTEVMPDPSDQNSALAQSYAKALETFETSEEQGFNETGLEGYLLGRYVISTLERMGTDLSRDAFSQHIRPNTPVNIDDWVVEFSAGSNKGSRYVRLTSLGEPENSQSNIQFQEEKP